MSNVYINKSVLMKLNWKSKVGVNKIVISMSKRFQAKWRFRCRC